MVHYLGQTESCSHIMSQWAWLWKERGPISSESPSRRIHINSDAWINYNINHDASYITDFIYIIIFRYLEKKWYLTQVSSDPSSTSDLLLAQQTGNQEWLDPARVHGARIADILILVAQAHNGGKVHGGGGRIRKTDQREAEREKTQLRCRRRDEPWMNFTQRVN